MNTKKLSKFDHLQNVFSRFRAYFFSGLLVIAPVAITFYVVLAVVSWMDSLITGIIPERYSSMAYMPFNIPGFGLILGVAILVGIGAIVTGVFGRMLVHFGERMLHKTPIIRGIYGAVKQIFQAVLEKDSKSLKEVVLVEYPRKGIWSLGFVTGTTKGEVQADTKDEVLNVFIPTTPNPTSGFLLFIPRKEVKTLTMSVEEGMKMIISVGIITPKIHNEENNS